MIRVAGMLLLLVVQQPTFSKAGTPRPNEALPPPARRLDYLSAAHLTDAQRRVAGSGSMGTTVLTSADQQTTHTLVNRTERSDIEEHSRWDDIVIVRRGRGIVEFGERVTGARVRAHGELRGGRFAAEGAEPFEYLIVKVRRANLPLKRTADGNGKSF